MYISTDEDLRSFCERARAFEAVAVDTEFLREKTYHPRLCLVQVATPEECVAIDPLAVGDLAPLASLLGDPAVTKVFHACSQDMEVLLQTLGTLPAPIFDTQVAAAFLGERQQISYKRARPRLLRRHPAQERVAHGLGAPAAHGQAARVRPRRRTLPHPGLPPHGGQAQRRGAPGVGPRRARPARGARALRGRQARGLQEGEARELVHAPAARHRPRARRLARGARGAAEHPAQMGHLGRGAHRPREARPPRRGGGSGASAGPSSSPRRT